MTNDNGNGNDIFTDDDFKRLADEVKSLKGDRSTMPAARTTAGTSAPRMNNIIKEEPNSQTQANQGECVFCKIVNKEIPARVVLDNDDFVAFLDIQPKSVGHTVIVSKRHVEDYCGLDVTEQNALNEVVATVVGRMKKRLNANGYSIVSANGVSSGQTVPHFSMHIIPTFSQNAVELPILSLVQPQKVPSFVHDIVFKLLATDEYAGGATKVAEPRKSAYQGFQK